MRLSWIGSFTAVASLAAFGFGDQAQVASQVKLPLKDYLALVEKVEAVEHAQAEVAARREPAVAAVVSRDAHVLWREASAEISTTFEVEIRGTPVRPVPLAVTGAISKATITPGGSAALRAGARGPELVVVEPGRYTIRISSVARLATDARGSRLDLVADDAPVSATTVDLPAELAWQCPGAILASEDLQGNRRVIRLAVGRNAAWTLRAWKQVKGEEEEKALARAVVVTVVRLTADGARRHDIVLYEVSRGSLATLDVTLPPGLDVERMATDEGELPSESEGRHVVVQRTQRLTGIGHLVLTSTLVKGTALSLEPVTPAIEVRARYLAWAPDMAAEATPEPKETWTRVDMGDLPEAIRSVSDGIKLAAAWLATGTPSGATLALAPVPPAGERETLIRRRETVTLLTKEGTVLHRDVFALARAGAALELRVPADAALWSASVNGLAVRPILRNGSTLVALPAGVQAVATVATVVVQERAIAAGRSNVVLAPPEVSTPVLEHDWRLLLPAENTYRYAGGTLRPAPEPSGPTGAVERRTGAGPVGWSPAAAPSGASAPEPTAGYAVLTGRVTDGTDALPGVSVTITSRRIQGTRTTVTDTGGNYVFRFLPPDDCRVKFELPGFQTIETSSKLVAAGTQTLNATMPQAKVAEEVTVTGQLETISTSSTRATTVEGDLVSMLPAQRSHAAKAPAVEKVDEEARARAAFRDEVANLKQGLVGGVRPVPVTVPESGKALFLAGALPPPAVSVALDVKAKR